ncbi:predicted amidophosphoribosyltransferases [Moorella thermoacetica Y72]|uniref:Predicted amidophosphoribosyltransferases n=1 Tax=Moorella thermoacetica Y72 TaxID=1325331 RepID=A0A0S6UEQ6_NEOTH|nr:ComF family protein [Moorella thermoacetica]GAF25996.1 predicted amidophosphoribosyltransferases [Moorella thermoacetica Y72]
MPAFINLLFPRRKTCAWCGRPVDRGLFCPQCHQELYSWQEKYHPCRYCGRLLAAGRGAVCRQCREELPPFRRARAVGAYRGILKELIWAFKYQGRRSLAAPLGQLLAGVVVRELGSARPHLVIPVPLTAARLQARTFNQAELLARALGRELGLAVSGQALARMRETAPQVGLSRRERWQNLAGAFQVQEPALVKGHRLLLVDDVMTTGATAAACTGALLAAGAAVVEVVTLATGIDSIANISP